MWPYTDDEQIWLEKNASQTQPVPQGQDYLPDYYWPEPELTIDFYRQRAHRLRGEAIGRFFRQLGAMTGGHHGRIETIIDELRGPTPRIAGNAGR